MNTPHPPDEALRKHITRRLGADGVRMAEQYGFAYAVLDAPHQPYIELYCVCCHCRRTWTLREMRESAEFLKMQRVAYDREHTNVLLDRFFRGINRECEIPHLVAGFR